MTDDRRDRDDPESDDSTPKDDGDEFSDPIDELGADEEPIDDPFAELGGGASEDDAHDGESVDDESFADHVETAANESDGPLFGEAKTGADERDTDGYDSGERDSSAHDADASNPEQTSTDGPAVSSAAVGEQSGEDNPFDEIGPSTDDADLDEAFERMDVGDLSDEDVWKLLDEDASDGPAGRGAAGFDSASPFGDASVDRVVSKKTYCQQCPHFSKPPEATCNHEGTTILEAVGFDEFRVRNCPMVDDDPAFDASDE